MDLFGRALLAETCPVIDAGPTHDTATEPAGLHRRSTTDVALTHKGHGSEISIPIS